MKALDGRHRWESVDYGGHVTHTCRVCGRTITFEKFLPDAFVERALELLRRPNPYRALARLP